MNTIWIVPLEPLDNRYTKQWFCLLPQLLNNRQYEINNVEGFSQISNSVTPGAFLNFAGTNDYKASQAQKIALAFSNGKVKPGDKFVYTDAWNAQIIQTKYMSELLDIPVEIHAIWHAGNYDPTDILGSKMKKDWASNFERSIFHAVDYNYFATKFHLDMFVKNLSISDQDVFKKAVQSGQPHNEIVKSFLDLPPYTKTKTVVWPHRYNNDKNIKLLDSLIPILKEKGIEVVITQRMNLSKYEYYRILKQSSLVLSTAFHENLGIGMMEGVLADCVPLAPNRSSYIEMYKGYGFVYNPLLTAIELADKIEEFINAAPAIIATDNFKKCKQNLLDKYLNANVMVRKILNENIRKD